MGTGSEILGVDLGSGRHVGAREVASGPRRTGLARGHEEDRLRLLVLATAGLATAGSNGASLVGTLDVGVEPSRFEERDDRRSLLEVLELVVDDQRQFEVVVELVTALGDTLGVRGRRDG